MNFFEFAFSLGNVLRSENERYRQKMNKKSNQEIMKLTCLFQAKKHEPLRFLHVANWEIKAGQNLGLGQFISRFQNQSAQQIRKIMRIASAGIATMLVGLCKSEVMENQVKNCIQKNLIGECTDCEYRYIIKNGLCEPVSLQCNTWSPLTAECLSCYDGWTLKNGACVVGESASGAIGGGAGAGVAGGNLVCGFKQYPKDGKCLPVSEQCKTWSSQSGDCLSCYDGWALKSGACVIPEIETGSSGPGTGTEGGSGTGSGTEGGSGTGSGTEGGSGTGTEGGNVGAVACGFKEYPKDGKCLPVSQQCKTWSSLSGDCLTCYLGWTLNNGACVLSESGSTADGTCPFKQYPKDGKCLPVSQQCKTWNTSSGDCQSCYDGWNLKNGACTL